MQQIGFCGYVNPSHSAFSIRLCAMHPRKKSSPINFNIALDPSLLLLYRSHASSNLFRANSPIVPLCKKNGNRYKSKISSANVLTIPDSCVRHILSMRVLTCALRLKGRKQILSFGMSDSKMGECDAKII